MIRFEYCERSTKYISLYQDAKATCKLSLSYVIVGATIQIFNTMWYTKKGLQKLVLFIFYTQIEDGVTQTNWNKDNWTFTGMFIYYIAVIRKEVE